MEVSVTFGLQCLSFYDPCGKDDRARSHLTNLNLSLLFWRVLAIVMYLFYYQLAGMIAHCRRHEETSLALAEDKR